MMMIFELIVAYFDSSIIFWGSCKNKTLANTKFNRVTCIVQNFNLVYKYNYMSLNKKIITNNVI